MTREEVIQLAKETGLTRPLPIGGVPGLMEFAEKVAEIECAALRADLLHWKAKAAEWHELYAKIMR
jgi:hypothetical protein